MKNVNILVIYQNIKAKQIQDFRRSVKHRWIAAGSRSHITQDYSEVHDGVESLHCLTRLLGSFS